MKKKKKRTRKTVRVLKWARRCKRPDFIPESRCAGAAQRGLVYERKVAEHLRAQFGGRVLHGQWIEYCDQWGYGVCQPDIIILPETSEEPILILECKLTVNKEAERKLKNIYKKVVAKTFNNNHILIAQVACNLSKGWKGNIVSNLEEIYQSKGFVTWIKRRV